MRTLKNFLKRQINRLYYKSNNYNTYYNIAKLPIGSYFAHETGLVFEVVTKTEMVCVSAFSINPLQLSIANKLFFSEKALDNTKRYLEKRKEELQQADEFELLMEIKKFEETIKL